MALNSSFLLLLFFNQKKSSERGDYSKQPLGKGTCWESRRGILQSSLRLIAKGWGTRRKNQISCDRPLIAAPLLEWCHEEKKIFPPSQSLNEDFGTSDEGTTLGELGGNDKRVLEGISKTWEQGKPFHPQRKPPACCRLLYGEKT